MQYNSHKYDSLSVIIKYLPWIFISGLLFIVTIALIVLTPQQASATPADCSTGARLSDALGGQVTNGTWTYPAATNVGNFRSTQARTTFTNTSATTLYDVKVTLPYVYLQQGTRYRPAHWDDTKGLYITGIGNASPDATNQGMDTTDPGFTAFILGASEKPAGELTPWSRERAGDIPMESLTATYYNAGFPTSLTEDDRIPVWNLGDIMPGQTVDFSLELRHERRANGAAHGWWLPEMHVAVNLGCAPKLTDNTAQTIPLSPSIITSIASNVVISDFDTIDFNGSKLTFERSGIVNEEVLTFGLVGTRVELDTEAMTILIDNSIVGTFTDTNGIVSITFTSALSKDELETLIHSLGITNVKTVGVQSGYLTLMDPEGNVSNRLTFTVSSVDDTIPPVLDVGTPQAPNTGFVPELKMIIDLFLTSAIGMTIILLLVILYRSKAHPYLGQRR